MKYETLIDLYKYSLDEYFVIKCIVIRCNDLSNNDNDHYFICEIIRNIKVSTNLYEYNLK